MPTSLRLAALALAAWFVASPAAAGAQAVPFNEIAAALNSVHQFGEVALSPDGRYLAYVESVGDRSAIRIAVGDRSAIRIAATIAPGQTTGAIVAAMRIALRL